MENKSGRYRRHRQELGSILTGEASVADEFQTAAKESGDGKKKLVEAAVPGAEVDDRGRDARHYGIEPALSPTITRKLSQVIPANLQIDARWDAIRKARHAAKKRNGKNAPSPSVMIAWSVVRAMKAPPFRRLILKMIASSRTKISTVLLWPWKAIASQLR
jgi:2-oxoisovalerate dehydrogenase E1 component